MPKSIQANAQELAQILSKIEGAFAEYTSAANPANNFFAQIMDIIQNDKLPVERKLAAITDWYYQDATWEKMSVAHNKLHTVIKHELEKVPSTAPLIATCDAYENNLRKELRDKDFVSTTAKLAQALANAHAPKAREKIQREITKAQIQLHQIDTRLKFTTEMRDMLTDNKDFKDQIAAFSAKFELGRKTLFSENRHSTKKLIADVSMTLTKLATYGYTSVGFAFISRKDPQHSAGAVRLDKHSLFKERTQGHLNKVERLINSHRHKTKGVR